MDNWNERAQESYAKKLLNDLYKVGPDKPIGYLPLSTIKNICKKDLTELEREISGKGLNTMVFQPGESKIGSGALFAYDPKVLAEILQRNIRMLENCGWPAQPSEFVRRVAMEQVSADQPLFELIADCFADTENPLRSSNRGLNH